ncbi:tyrosine-type recombinase/integrase [Ectorhizobium quercum]|uniref:tyrosine-type recombinase/integrase n=1 Tax=Ectorhizobium quercum TaxID=2965071 RepID=UPI003522198E
MPLTDTAVRQARFTGKDYTLGDLDGLSLNVSARGGKSWHFRYCWLGRQKRMSLGTYPEVSLREARSLKDEARALLAKGINPHVHRKQKRFSARLAGENTFEAVFQLWHAHRGLSLRKGRQTDLTLVERVFAKDVFPLLGKRSVYDIRRHDLLDVLARVEQRRAFSVAKKIRCWFNQMFRYALVKVPGLETNPASDLDVVALPAPPVRNNPFLRMEQLPAFLKTLRDYPGRMQTQLGLRLLLLTGVRTGELRHATPDQFHLDQGLWIIPVELVKQLQLQLRKQGRRAQDVPPYIVPLSVQAIEIVRHLLEQKRPAQRYLFRHDYDLKKRMSENTLNHVLKRMGYEDMLTGHGMRATMSTALHEIGYPKIWIEAQLSHADPDPMSSIYNHAEYVEPRRRMMQDWADRLDLFEQDRVEQASMHLPVTLIGSQQTPRDHAAGLLSVIPPVPTLGVPGHGQAEAGALPAVGRLPAVRPRINALLPEVSRVQCERMARLAIYNAPNMLPVALYAHAWRHIGI